MAHALRTASVVAVSLIVAMAGCLAQPEDYQRPAWQRERPWQNQQQRQGERRDQAAFIASSPRVGETAPDFTLRTPDGRSVTLSDLYAEKPVVLQFGSMTCPVYRGKIPAMQSLRERFGDAFHWITVYTVEAHPSGCPSPYTGEEWVGERNQREGVLITQPTDYQARAALAQQVVNDYGEQFVVLIDDMDNAVWEQYGKRPNSAFVIDQGGVIIEKQFWANPRRLEQVLAELADEEDRGVRTQQADSIAEPSVSFENNMWVMRDIRYGEVDGYPLLLDAYLPADDEVHPALIYIHGGGWRSGDKAGGFQAVRGDQLIAAGIAVFSINYRLSGVAPYPAAVEDCLTAIRWIRANAAELNIDPDRLAVWGASAGGHLALMMGYLEPGSEDLDAEGNRLQNFVRCIVDKNGPTDLAADDMHHERALLLFMATTRDQDPERYREASPLTHLSADDPPVLIMHGTEDQTVPYSQTVALTEKLDELGIEYELFTFEGAGHGLRGADREDVDAAMRRAVEFVQEHLLGE